MLVDSNNNGASQAHFRAQLETLEKLRGTPAYGPAATAFLDEFLPPSEPSSAQQQALRQAVLNPLDWEQTRTKLQKLAPMAQTGKSSGPPTNASPATSRARVEQITRSLEYFRAQGLDRPSAEQVQRMTSTLPVAELDPTDSAAMGQLAATLGQQVLDAKHLEAVLPPTLPTSGADVLMLRDAATDQLCGVFKLFRDDVDFLGELLAVRYLDRAGLEHSRPHQILSAARVHLPDGTTRFAAILEAAPGTEILSILKGVAAEPDPQTRRAKLEDATRIVQNVASALAELHTEMPRAPRASPQILRYNVDSGRARLEKALAGIESGGHGISPELRDQLHRAYEELAASYLDSKTPGCVVHGDPHSGNLFDLPGQKPLVVMVDIETLAHSLGPHGEGIADPGSDFARAFEGLRTKVVGFGFSREEIAQLQDAFLARYREQTPWLPDHGRQALLDFHRVRLNLAIVAGLSRQFDQARARGDHDAEHVFAERRARQFRILLENLDIEPPEDLSLPDPNAPWDPTE